jgi:hypothetical protein
MVWFFAAVVLWLLVARPGFRRFMMWACGVVVLVASIGIGPFV